jgi:hypothetical protein
MTPPIRPALFVRSIFAVVLTFPLAGLLALAVVRYAHAESGWVLWKHIYVTWATGTKHEWLIDDAWPTVEGCIALGEAAALYAGQQQRTIHLIHAIRLLSSL